MVKHCVKRKHRENNGVGGGHVEEEDERREWSSEVSLAIGELSLLKHEPQDKEAVPTLAFLALCHLLLQVLDKIGPTMAVLALDARRNIERLEELYVSDPSKFCTLIEILEKEAREGTARKADSCSKAVLWLARSLDFTIALLQRLREDSDLSLVEIVEDAYTSTLKPWHGWIASAAYKIALKLIPERNIFLSLLGAKGQSLDICKDQIGKLLLLLQPLLDGIHSLMGKFRLDRLKST